MSMSVAEHCQAQGVTWEQFVERCSLPPDRLMAIVAVRWTPSPEERAAVATALGIEVSDITWGHKTPIQHIYGHGPG